MVKSFLLFSVTECQGCTKPLCAVKLLAQKMPGFFSSKEILLGFSMCQGHQTWHLWETVLEICGVELHSCWFLNYLQHLKQQQEGLSHLISIIKDDLEDIKLIEHGLNESIPIRGGVFSWRGGCCWAYMEHITWVHGSPSKAKTGEVK